MVHLRMILSIVLVFVFMLSCRGHMRGVEDDLRANREMATEIATERLPASEMQALQDLYDSAQGDKWLWKTNTMQTPWNFTDPNVNPCTANWQGITCQYSGGEYQHVSYLVLPNYGLNGTLPSSLGTFSQLVSLKAYTNDLSGTIPISLGNLSQLVYLELYTNKLTGPIPSSLCKLSRLRYIELFNNSLIGTIPGCLGALSQLLDLDIGINPLSGTIPASLGNLSLLVYLYIYQNRLTGTVPETLSKLHRLKVFSLQTNHLTGRVPEFVGNYTHLTYLGIFNNSLVGTIPAALGNLSHLVDLYIGTNKLTGTIPHTLSNLHQLQAFSMNSNFLTGVVPDFVSSNSHLQYLELSNNYLVGTIPASVGNLSALFELNVAHNYLTGTIPRSVANVPTLNSFIIDHNSISGSLVGVFNATAQTNLVSIIVNNNQLTGVFPTAIFDLPILSTVIASTNCFYGQLPCNICNRTSLVSIVFDGLSSAPKCKNTLLPGLSRSYILEKAVHGTVPACLFQLPMLVTLHLSGNGFTGSIVPDTTAISPKVIDLSLSHNVLTGTIPVQIQDKPWAYLDLSFNRLQGSLSALLAAQIIHLNSSFTDFADDERVSLSLENNRLSGPIPHSIHNLRNISILGTNIFSCKLDGRDLPQHDSGASNYQCGSTEFDVPYYVWSGLSCLAAVLLGCVAYRKSSYKTNWEHWMRCVASCGVSASEVGASDLSQYRSIQGYCQVQEAVCKHAVVWTVVILVVLLPLYVALSHYYGTHLQTYAWTVSAAYLSGAVPFGLEMALWLLLIAAAMITMLTHCGWLHSTCTDDCERAMDVQSAINTAAGIATRTANKQQRALIYVLFLGVNIVIVGGVNVAYVYVSIYRSSHLLTFAQICMSFFKVIYNGVASMGMLRCIVQMVTGKQMQISSYASLQVLSALLNNIIIPCVVVLIVSPSCFYSVFTAAPPLDAVFSYEKCVSVTTSSTECSKYEHERDTTSYDPPFTYSYQCSSSLITYYAPAFVNLCIVSMFVVPLAHGLAVEALRSAGKDTRWYRMLDSVIPATWKIPAVGESFATSRTYFNPLKEQLVQLNLVALIFTFGVVFPPLAVSLTVTLLVSTVTTKLKLGRLLLHTSHNKGGAFVHGVERACASLLSSSLLRDFVGILSVIACLLYMLFLYDTLGDAVGFDRAYWVLIVVPFPPVCATCVHLALGKYSPFSDRRAIMSARSSSKGGPTTELTTVVSAVHGSSSFTRNTHSDAINVLLADAEAQ